MNVYFLVGNFFSVDAYALNDFNGMPLGACTDITAEDINGDASFNHALFFSRLTTGS